MKNIIISFMVVFALIGCSKPQKSASYSYEAITVNDDGAGDIFKYGTSDNGESAIKYNGKHGLIDITRYILDEAYGLVYITIESAYKYGDKYLVVFSTGQGGASCPATTYIFSFDAKTEKVIGKDNIDGCSEATKVSISGDKLSVFKDGNTKDYIKGDLLSVQPQAEIIPQAAQEVVEQPSIDPLQVGKEQKVFGTNNGFSWTMPLATFVPTVDEVVVNNIVVNRGNCDIDKMGFNPGGKFPATLKFGQKYKLNLSAGCDPIEITVDSSYGQFVYNF